LNRRTAKFLQIGLPLGLGVFLCVYVYSRFSPEQLREVGYHFGEADYGIVAIAVSLSVLSHLIRAYRWNYLLQPMGYKPSLANNFMAVSVAYLMNLFIPKSGEVSRAIILRRYESVPFDKGFGTIISERVVDLIFLLGFTALAFALKFSVLYSYLDENALLEKAGYVVALIAALGLGAFLVFNFVKHPLIEKLSGFLAGLKEGMLSVVRMKGTGTFLMHSFFIWGLYLLSFYVSTQALEATSDIGWGTLVITFVLGSFTFAFTNSGFGTYPVVVAGILFVFAIPETVGTAFGWIVWISNIASIVFFGLLSLILLPIYNSRN
jgi:uncharacterized protein (TIRG00374 family)